MPLDDATRARVERDRANAVRVQAAMDLGFVTQDAYRSLGYLLHKDEFGRDVLAGMRTPSPETAAALHDPNSRQYATRSRLLEGIASSVDGQLQAYATARRRPGVWQFLETAGKTLATTLFGQGAAIYEAQAALERHGVRTAPVTVNPAELDEKAASVRNTINELFGVSPDAAVRAAEAMGGGKASTYGELTGVMTAFGIGLLGGPKGGGTGFFSRALSPAKLPLLPKVFGPYNAVLAGRSLSSVAWTGGGVGFLAGMYGLDPFHLIDGDKSLSARMTLGMSYAGLAVALPTVLAGRPAGPQAQALRDIDLMLTAKGQLPEAVRMARRGQWALALKYQPNLTVGHMLNSGAVGTAITYTMLRQKGAEPGDAAHEAVNAGLSWVGWDVAFAGLGSVQRVLKTQMAASGKAAQYLVSLGLVPAATGGLMAGIERATSDSGDPELAAAFAQGAGLMAMSRLSAVTPNAKRVLASQAVMAKLTRAAQQGDVQLSATRLDILARLQGVLPAESLEHLAAMRFGNVPHDAMRMALEIVTDTSWREALYDEYVALAAKGSPQAPAARAFAEQFRNAIGAIGADSEELLTQAERFTLTRELLSRELKGETMVNSPDVWKGYGRLAELRDAQGRILDQQATDAAKAYLEERLPVATSQPVIVAPPDTPPPLSSRADLRVGKHGKGWIEPTGPAWTRTMVERAAANLRNGDALTAAREAVDAAVATTTKNTDVTAVRSALAAVGADVRQVKGRWIVDMPDVARGEHASLRSAIAQVKDVLDGIIVPASAVAGYYLYDNLATQQDGFAWMPNDDGLAAMAVAGVILPRGGALRMSSIARVLRRVAVQAGELGRETAFVLSRTGNAAYHVGKRDSVSLMVPQRVATALDVGLANPKTYADLRAVVDEPNIVFDFHTHPPHVRGTPGGMLLNSYPSGLDSAFSIYDTKNQVSVVGTAEGKFTVYTRNGTPKEYQDTFNATMLEIGRAVGVQQRLTSSQILDLAIERHGEQVISTYINRQLLAKAKVDVQLNVPASHLDATLAGFARQGRFNPEESLAEATLRPSFEEPIANVEVSAFKQALRTAFREEIGVAPELRAVAPVGARSVRAPLPTRQPSPGASVTLAEAQTWAAARGARVDVVDASRFRLTNLANGAPLGEARSLTALIAGYRGAERGSIETATATELTFSVGGGLTGTLTGGLLGPIISDYINEDDNSATAAIIGATVGGVLGIALGATGARKINTYEASRLARIKRELEVVVPTGKAPLNLADSRAHAGFKKSKLPPDDFANYHPQAQHEHLISRLDSISGTRVDAKNRGELLRATLQKYTMAPPSFAAAAELENRIRTVAKTAKLDDIEAENLIRGYWSQVATEPAKREHTAYINLARTNVTPAGPFGSATSTEELRNVIAAAKRVSGPSTTPVQLRQAVANFHRRTTQINPANALLRVAAVTASKADRLAFSHAGQETADVARGEIAASGFMGFGLGQLRPAEGLRTMGESLRAKGDPTGNTILRMIAAIFDTDRNMRADIEISMKKVDKLLNSLTKGDLDLVRYVMEGDGRLTAADYRARYAGNQALLRAADGVRTVFNEVAQRNGLNPADFRWVEDYFPRYYSQRAVADLRRSGVLPEDAILRPPASAVPIYKWWRSMEPRTATTPLGPRVTDVREVAGMYLYGGIRKLHLDRMYSVVRGEDLAALAEVHPHVAARLAQLVIDLHGIPSGDEMALGAYLRGIGVDMHLLAQAYGVDESFFVKPLLAAIDRGTDSATLISTIKSFEFHSKMLFSPVTAAVQASQLINGMADLGVSRVFMGAVTTTVGGNAAKLPIINYLAPAKGAAALRVAEQYGVASPGFFALLDHIGSAGAMGGRHGAVKRALNAALWVGRSPLAMIEYLLRSATFGAGAQLAQDAMTATGPLRERAGEILGNAALGAVAVGGVRGEFAREVGDDDVWEQTMRAALLGGLAGAIGGTIAKPLRRIAAEQRPIIAARHALEPEFTDKLVRLASPQDADAEAFMRAMGEMAVAQTQYSMTRIARPEALRRPAGEVFGTLQTFTYHQLEYAGKRMTSFVRDLTAVAHGRKAIDDVDMRIFRYMALLATASAGTSALVGFVSPDTKKGLYYWMSRIGIALMPNARYNQRAKTWQMQNLFDFLLAGGPVINDLTHGAQTYIRLAFDREARQAWTLQLDDLAQSVVVALRQLEDNTMAAADGLSVLGAEAMAERVRGYNETAAAVAHPVTAAAHAVGATEQEVPVK